MFLLISIFFFLYSIYSIFFWITVWQKSGYQLRVLLNRVKHLSRKKVFIQLFPFLFFILIILLYGIVIISDTYTAIYHSIVGMAFFIAGSYVLYKTYRKSLRYPIFSLKALTISLGTTFVVSVMYMIPLLDSYVWLVFLTFFIPVLIACFVGLLSFPSEIYEDMIFEKAANAITVNKKLKIILITGDYKKHIVQEYLFQTLSQDFQVVKISPAYTTILDIAKAIFQNVTPETQILLVAVAGQKEELGKLSKILKANVLIETADLHSDRDVMHIVKRRGAFLYPGSIPRKQFTQRAPVSVVSYVIENDGKKGKQTISALHFSLSKVGIRWRVRMGNTISSYSSTLISVEDAFLMLPVVFVARQFGLKPVRIQKILTGSLPPKGLRELFVARNGVVYVDGTNASVNDIRPLLGYMRLYKGNRILVWSTGNDREGSEQTIYREMGKELVLCTTIFLLNNNFYRDILTGLESKETKTNLVVASAKSIGEQIVGKVKKGDIVVFVGKETRNIFLKLLL